MHRIQREIEILLKFLILHRANSLAFSLRVCFKKIISWCVLHDGKKWMLQENKVLCSMQNSINTIVMYIAALGISIVSLEH